MCLSHDEWCVFLHACSVRLALHVALFSSSLLPSKACNLAEVCKRRLDHKAGQYRIGCGNECHTRVTIHVGRVPVLQLMAKKKSRFFATAGMDLWPSFAVLLACVVSCIDAAIPAQGQATVFEPQQAKRCINTSGMQFLSSQRASDREDAFVHQ